MKSMTLVAATALAGALYIVSPAAKADVMFGSVTPTPACAGSVCGTDETFTSGGATVVAHGFTGGPGPGAGDNNLTLKSIPPFDAGESGLGVGGNTGSGCTAPDCEILPPNSVSVTGFGNTLITDAVIGSVQGGEEFNFFVQVAANGGFMQLNSMPIDSSCNFPGGAVAGTDECSWNGPARFGVAVQAVTGDELLTSVSTSSVPGPIVGAGLPGLLAACGALLALVRRRRQHIA